VAACNIVVSRDLSPHILSDILKDRKIENILNIRCVKELILYIILPHEAEAKDVDIFGF
jgi:hypothetical protein